MSVERSPAPAATVFLLDATTSEQHGSTPSIPLYRVFLAQKLDGVLQSEWDALLDLDDAPLVSWGYLQGLEESACVGGNTSWQPAHLCVRRVMFPSKAELDRFASSRKPPSFAEGELVAAAPAYLKYNSDGEWVDDFEWAAYAEHKGAAYYPKLVMAVPFNPVGGGRLLTQPQFSVEQQVELRMLLLHAAKRICQMVPLSGAHVLFPRPDDKTLTALSRGGFMSRQQEQYHFLNRSTQGKPYESFEDFLSDMRGHRRNTIRRERRALLEAGYSVSTHRGYAENSDDAKASGRFSARDLDRMYDLYLGTSLRYTGLDPYLNRRFFQLAAQRLGDRLELVLARDRDGEITGGAWNLRGDRRLFGRYWGQREGARIPFLHFECCYYHSIDRCISERLDAFEPGHGGEHKLIRGFSPVLTHSAHFLREAKLRRPIANYLGREAPAVLASLDAARSRCPLPSALIDPTRVSDLDASSDLAGDNSADKGPSSRSD